MPPLTFAEFSFELELLFEPLNLTFYIAHRAGARASGQVEESEIPRMRERYLAEKTATQRPRGMHALDRFFFAFEITLSMFFQTHRLHSLVWLVSGQL